MKDPVKLLIFLLVAVTIGMTIAFFLPERTNKANEAPKPDSLFSAAENRKEPEMKNPEIEPEEDAEGQVSAQETPAQTTDEEIVALPVDGNPMVVTLLDFPELGQISIAEWSDELGDFTGKPVKSGTKLQIMNPHKKGERLWFIAP